MTPGMMGRLFIVPALIVCVLMGVAVVVVLFGTTSMEQADSIDELLARLEQGGGDRQFDPVLMPREKTYWQAAQTLARRLSDKHLEPGEIEPTAQRLIAILGKLGPGRDLEEPGGRQQYFVMMALSQLGTASGVEALADYLHDASGGGRIAAMRALAAMGNVPDATDALSAVLPMLEDQHTTVVLVACAAVGALAEPGDAAAIAALSATLEADREVQWNAAMALARLGSVRGKRVLMNMLDRSYWEGVGLDYEESGRMVRRKYTDVEVSNYLTVAIKAASCLDDVELQGLISGLRGDQSHVVSEAAREACRGRGDEQSVASRRAAITRAG